MMSRSNMADIYITDHNMADMLITSLTLKVLADLLIVLFLLVGIFHRQEKNGTAGDSIGKSGGKN